MARCLALLFLVAFGVVVRADESAAQPPNSVEHADPPPEVQQQHDSASSQHEKPRPDSVPPPLNPAPQAELHPDSAPALVQQHQQQEQEQLHPDSAQPPGQQVELHPDTESAPPASAPAQEAHPAPPAEVPPAAGEQHSEQQPPQQGEHAGAGAGEHAPDALPSPPPPPPPPPPSLNDQHSGAGVDSGAVSPVHVARGDGQPPTVEQHQAPPPDGAAAAAGGSGDALHLPAAPQEQQQQQHDGAAPELPHEAAPLPAPAAPVPVEPVLEELHRAHQAEMEELEGAFQRIDEAAIEEAERMHRLTLEMQQREREAEEERMRQLSLEMEQREAESVARKAEKHLEERPGRANASPSGVPSGSPKRSPTPRRNVRRPPRVQSRFGADLVGRGFYGGAPEAGHPGTKQRRGGSEPDARGEGEPSLLEDDYYGMNMNPADHVDAAAFQPSHTLSFELPPGQSVDFFDEVTPGDVGKVVRGDWFVTSGETLDAIVSVTDAVGAEVYREGPTRAMYPDSATEQQEPASEGSFRFYADNEGVLRVRVTNPSPYEARTLTLAWLKGRDDDDPFTAAPDEAWDLPEGDPHADALIANPRNASAYVSAMLGRVSGVHKRIDELVAQQAFMNVLYRRHAGTLDRVHGRVVRFALAETAAIVLVALLQVAVIRRFDFKRDSMHTYHSGLGGAQAAAWSSSV